MRVIQFSLLLTAAVLGFCFFGVESSEPVYAPESHCDPRLQQAQNDPYGYRLRGDRCEGVYIKEITGTTTIASLTEYVEDFNPAAVQSLRVEWNSPLVEPVHLRAYSLRHRLHYQMDSERPTGSTSFTWPTNLLAALSLGRREVGLLAWISCRVGNTVRAVYLPVRVGQPQAPGNSRAYHLVLVPGEELDEVFITTAFVKKDGSLAVATRDQELGYGYYPADRSITITVPQAKTPGIYYLKIGATLKAGGSSTREVWFYHNGD